LSVVMPFGKPIDTNLANITQIINVPFTPGEDSVKRPATVPHLYKGSKQFMEFQIVETINGIQYDKEKAPNLLQIQGTIQSKILLEGFPEITVPLSLVENMPGKLGQINTHPCVQNLDYEKTKKFVFNSQMDTPFSLCHYTVNDVDKMPMRGFYQMKEISPTEVKLLLQIKLEEYVKNEFEYCRVILPFFNHGNIENVSATVTTGEYTVREDKKAIVWDIGTKFTNKNKEVALPATVHFNLATKHTKNGDGDPFCVGSNCYAKMEFKVLGYSHVNIVNKNIVIQPKGAPPKITVDRYFMAGEYVIWNSWGKVNYAWQPPVPKV